MIWSMKLELLINEVLESNTEPMDNNMVQYPKTSI